MNADEEFTVSRLARIEMVCSNPGRLSGFYQAAFGFRQMEGTQHHVPLRLGDQEIALIATRPPGKPYPAKVSGWNPLFQHIAIIVADMAGAYAQLCSISGWTPISTAGPQLLPAASGGVTAFKFRDPEGHPLELIAFAPNAVPTQWRASSNDLCLGIDHSAISVSNTSDSIDFYESLGVTRSGGSLNIGTEQAKLDDVADAVVEVTALDPRQSTPHLELLCYRGDFDRRVLPQSVNDITATRLVFAVEKPDALDRLRANHREYLVARSDDDARRVMLRDPDGHLVLLERE
jgi:catechol 2,3-dioxygenase-like lactoylglutathione lyase family enzyme